MARWGASGGWCARSRLGRGAARAVRGSSTSRRHGVLASKWRTLRAPMCGRAGQPCKARRRGPHLAGQTPARAGAPKPQTPKPSHPAGQTPAWAACPPALRPRAPGAWGMGRWQGMGCDRERGCARNQSLPSAQARISPKPQYPQPSVRVCTRRRRAVPAAALTQHPHLHPCPAPPRWPPTQPYALPPTHHHLQRGEGERLARFHQHAPKVDGALRPPRSREGAGEGCATVGRAGGGEHTWRRRSA